MPDGPESALTAPLRGADGSGSENPQVAGVAGPGSGPVAKPSVPRRRERLKTGFNAKDPRVELGLVTADWLYAVSQLLGVKLKEARRAISGINPIYFGLVYFPEMFPLKTPDFHWRIINNATKLNRYAVAATVGTGKTTILTKLTPPWEIFHRGFSEVLSVSNSNDMASSWLDEMRVRMAGSDALREDFGDFIGQHWGSTEAEYLVPAAGPDGKAHRGLVRARGRCCAIRGMRPDHILLDDPQDEESLKSERQRDDFREWFWGALITRLDTEKKLLTMIATAINENAFICELVNNPPPGWTAESLSILDDDGHSVWPEKYSDDYLAMRLAEMGEIRYAADYLNAPISRTAGRKFTGVATGERRPVGKGAFLSMCLDPAFAAGGDPWAFTVVEQTKDRMWHVHEAIQENTGTLPMVEKLFELFAAYPNLDVIGIELGGGEQTALTYLIAEKERAYNRHLPIMWLRHGPNRSKESRIDMLVPLINTGRLELDPALYDLRREIVDYRAGLKNQRDNLLDSLAMHLEVQLARRPDTVTPLTQEEVIRERFRGIMRANEKMRPPRPRRSLLDRYGNYGRRANG